MVITSGASNTANDACSRHIWLTLVPALEVAITSRAGTVSLPFNPTSFFANVQTVLARSLFANAFVSFSTCDDRVWGTVSHALPHVTAISYVGPHCYMTQTLSPHIHRPTSPHFPKPSFPSIISLHCSVTIRGSSSVLCRRMLCVLPVWFNDI
jgi:hypothetical protein